MQQNLTRRVEVDTSCILPDSSRMIEKLLIDHTQTLLYYDNILRTSSLWNSHVQTSGQDSYLLQCCQAFVHSQGISQGSSSRIFNFIPSKTVEESTPELVLSADHTQILLYCENFPRTSSLWNSHVQTSCQDSYLLQCSQALVHSQSISQGSGSRISNSIPSKTVEGSTPELVQVVKIN